MNKTVGYILGALALGVTAFAIGYGWKKGTAMGAGESNFEGDTSNAAGQTGTNTCKPPHVVIQGNCVLPPNTQGGAKNAMQASVPAPIGAKIASRVF